MELDELKKSPKGKKLKNELNSWQQAAATIVQQYQVQDLLQLSYEVTTHKRVKRGYRGSPARMIQESEIHLTVALNEQALTQAISRLGWRVYVTNQSVEELSLNEAVGVYREQYLIEQGFSRLKGSPLSLTPIYLQRDDYWTVRSSMKRGPVGGQTEGGGKNTPLAKTAGMFDTGRVIQTQPDLINYAPPVSGRANFE